MKSLFLFVLLASTSFTYGSGTKSGLLPKKIAPLEAETRVRSLPYNTSELPRINTRERYTTVIVLPVGERVNEVTCGDKEFWVINAGQNLVYVKPAKKDAHTNVNILTNAGRLYSFLLDEVSTMALKAELRVVVQLKDDEPNATPSAPKEIEEFKRQVEAAKAETKLAKESAEQAASQKIDRFRSEYPGKLIFDYAFRAKKRPFCVSAIFHDDRFTYIQASPQEIPTLYEVKEGKPNLISFEYRNRAFVATKIIDEGYLMIGNAKMTFKRRRT